MISIQNLLRLRGFPPLPLTLVLRSMDCELVALHALLAEPRD